MQRLNADQGDACIDIVLKCKTVGLAYERRAACKCRKDAEGKKMATEAEERFQAALSELGNMASAAEDILGVDDDVIQGIFKKHLPPPMVKEAA